MKKKDLFFKIPIAVIMAVMTAVPSISVSALCISREIRSESVEQADNFGVIDSPASVRQVLQAERPQAQSGLSRAVSSLPSSYDARNYGMVTSVKNQDQFGTCWAFGAVASAECSILKQGFETTDSLDLSEMQFVYYTYTKSADKLGLTQGDYTLPSEETPWNIGSNNLISTFTMAKWLGLTNESNARYYSTSNTSDIQKYYSSDEMYDDKMAYENDNYHLQNAYWVDMGDVDSAKRAVLDYGGLSVAFNPSTVYYNTFSCGYYSYAASGTGHIVTIVGWDDNFSKKNFYDRVSKKRPDSDGAWLCKNSWGENACDNGYIWISYEDSSVRLEPATAFVMEKAGNYDNNYQYDGGTGSFNFTGSQMNSDIAYMANVFTANGDETLKAVSFYSLYPNINYTVQVYKNLTSSSNPTSGTPQFTAEQCGTLSSAGYFTVELNSQVKLEKGDTFSVVISVQGNGSTSGEKRQYCVFVDSTAAGNEYIEGLQQVSSSERGQSFVSVNYSRWYDTSYEYFPVASGYSAVGNVRIKAFTVNDENLGKTAISGSVNIDGTAKVGSTVTADLSNIGADESTYRVEWYANDELVGNGNSYTVTQDDDGKLLTLVARGVGNYCSEVRSTGSNVISEDGVTRIYTADQLYSVRYSPSATYELCADIFIDHDEYNPGGKFYHFGKGFVPIGNSLRDCFTGVFYGQGHTVGGLRVTAGDFGDNKGLFGYVTDGDNRKGGKIYDLNLVNSYVSGNSNVGGLIGYASCAQINNCSAVTGLDAKENVGGVIGLAENTVVSGCSASGVTTLDFSSGEVSKSVETINAEKNAGGVVGCAKGKDGKIEKCSNSLNFKSPSDCVGGIVGNVTDCIVSNNKNYGDITSTVSYGVASVGGIVGKKTITIYGDLTFVGYSANFGAVNAQSVSGVCGGIIGVASSPFKKQSYSVNYSYNCGKISGSGACGGIVGMADSEGSSVDVKYSYNTGDISGSTYCAGIFGKTNDGSVIDNCYNIGAISSGGSYCAAICAYGGSISNSFCLDDTVNTSLNTSFDTTVKVGKSDILSAVDRANMDGEVWKTDLSNGYVLPQLEYNSHLFSDGAGIALRPANAYSDGNRTVKIDLTALNGFNALSYQIINPDGVSGVVLPSEAYEISGKGKYTVKASNGFDRELTGSIAVYEVNYNIDGNSIKSYLAFGGEYIDAPTDESEGKKLCWFGDDGKEVNGFTVNSDLGVDGKYLDYGDVNGDGNCDMADAMILFNCASGALSVSRVAVPSLMDYDRNGAFGLCDVLAFLLWLKK